MTSNNISPKSYLNKNVFDNVCNIKKRGKITDDEFKMIKMEEYEHVINFQYKVSQLKQICLHYHDPPHPQSPLFYSYHTNHVHMHVADKFLDGVLHPKWFVPLQPQWFHPRVQLTSESS